MPSFPILAVRCGGKTLMRLFALMLALAIATPVLLAEEGDHGRDRDHELGKGNDLTGVWTETLENGYKVLFTFHEDGTADFDLQGDIVFDPVQSHAHGLWKEHGARTFIATFLVLEYNKDSSLYGTTKLDYVYTLTSKDTYDAVFFFTETFANGEVNPDANPFGPIKAHGERLILVPR
jgi:hypothetical protein